MKRLFILICLITWFFPPVQAQQDTLCARLYMDAAIADPGDTVSLAVRVDNIRDMIGLQTQITWDSSQVRLVAITDFNLPDLNPLNFNPIETANERSLLAFSWFTAFLDNQNPADGTGLFNIWFVLQPDFEDQTSIRFVSGNPTEIIYDADSLVARTIPTLLNGQISTTGPIPSLLESCVTSTGSCNLSDGAITTIPAGGTAPYAFEWAGPNGFFSSEASPDNLSAGTYTLTLTDSKGQKRTATFEVDLNTGAPLQIQVRETCTTSNVVTVEVFNRPRDMLYFEWSNGQSGWFDIMAVDLPLNTTYSLTVTNTLGCTQEITGTTPEACTINHPTGNQLTIGSSNLGDHSTVCLPVTLELAEEVQKTTVLLEWDSTQLAWQGWSPGITTRQLDIKPKSVIIQIDTFLAIGYHRLGAACFDVLEGPDPVLIVDGSRSSLVTTTDSLIIPKVVPGQIFQSTAPAVATLNIPDTTVANGIDFCLPVRINAQSRLAGLQFALTWDTSYLVFQEVNTVALNMPTASIFNTELAITDGVLPVLWVDFEGRGINLPENSTLFEVCFQAVGPEGSVPIELANTVLPSEFTYFDLRTGLGILEGGRVHILDQVFPGDANADGLVDYRDLANLGHAFGAQGPKREQSGLDFRGYLGMPWEGAFRQKKLNHRFADTNGDGMVDHADTLALHLNYGKTHKFAVEGLVSPSGKKEGIPLYLDIDTLVAGETVDIPVMLGTEAQPVSGVYNIRAVLDYNPAVVVPGSASFSVDDSWLGSDLLSIHQENSGAGQLAWAITRTDRLDLAGFGRIGTLSITIEDVIFSERSDTDVFKLLDGYMETAREEAVPVAPATTTVVIDQTVTRTDNILNADQVHIFPNPTTEKLYWITDIPSFRAVEILDLNGRPLLRLEAPTENWIDVTGLPNGIYQMRMPTDLGIVVKRFSIIR